MFAKVRHAKDGKEAVEAAHCYWRVHRSLVLGPSSNANSASIESSNNQPHFDSAQQNTSKSDKQRRVFAGRLAASLTAETTAFAVKLVLWQLSHDHFVESESESRLVRKAKECGLFSLISSMAIRAVCSQIASEIFDQIPHLFHVPLLDRFLTAARDFTAPKLAEMLGVFDVEGCENIGRTLKQSVYSAFVYIRLRELFDMIVDFPASQPALEEFKLCIHETDAYLSLKSSLSRIISHRLLHLGANTRDIIAVYVSTIKCLTFLDPSLDLLNSISDLIRNYLKTRSDAMRSVLNILTGNSQSNAENDGDEIIVGDIENANNLFSKALSDLVVHRNSKTKIVQPNIPADITTTLVQIFDSPDVFIREFQGLLAEKLLMKSDYDFENELKNLEMFKKYFSDSKMHQCEVMMKDMMESKRINTSIQNSNTLSPTAADEMDTSFANETTDTINIDIKILSRHFWPPLTSSDSQQNLPKSIKKFLDPYNEKFGKLKSMRKLKHVLGYGSVQLDLELEDRTVTLTATPAQAALIGFFDDHARWSADALAEVSGRTVASLEKALQFWVAKGILRRNNSDASYSVIEQIQNQDDTIDDSATAIDGDGGDEIAGEVGADGDLGGNDADILSVGEAMKPFFPFVQGMLTNFGAMPVERMHAMLIQFAQAPKYSESAERLRMYLDQLVEEEICEAVAGGMYGMRKK
ncbi:Anaphase-promoting complex subunit 2 [Physocladia obscura]|uniref:Anaphase-promoting complex subunit 2 n=1 Tax=Physocladia obscura TaxID=109957 RepID=A0AAD5XGU8_9FUNG|nr:Anaphase-promoting complex subunit 2 [Physocladia obscura]